MASCAAGKTFRVYGQYTNLVCKLMIKTWGHIFEVNEKKNTKNTCEPSKNLTPFYVDFATIVWVQEGKRSGGKSAFCRVFVGHSGPEKNQDFF